MSKEQLTARQTLLLGQAITAVDLAEKAAEEAEKTAKRDRANKIRAKAS